MSESTYTNSSLSTARSCLTKFDLGYNQRLELDLDEEREPLAVGSCWHHAHEMHGKGIDAYQAIADTAPNEIWNEKISRLFAAHGWYWDNQPVEVLIPEFTFDVTITGVRYRGQIDGIVKVNGRIGLLELKTTSEGVDDESTYFDKLRMDTQVGMYALAVRKLHGAEMEPTFILYDVVRKPTINPKRILKKDLTRMMAELANGGSAEYYGEYFTEEMLEFAMDDGRETIKMYGARLTADIGERPEYYFARREVPRTKQDFATLAKSINAQVRVIEFAQENDAMFRNPDSCAQFGRCEFFSLCSNNISPKLEDAAPTGFRRREHRHPELQP